MGPTSSRPTATAPLMAVLAALLLLSVSGPGAAAQRYLDTRLAAAPDERPTAQSRQTSVTPLSTSGPRVEFTNKAFRPGFGGSVTDLWMNADSATGPLLVNATGFVGFKMTVKNTGNRRLDRYTVTNNVLQFRQTFTNLLPGKDKTIIIQRPWARGQQSNTATLSGVRVGSTTLPTINDRAFYFGAQPRLKIDPFVKNDAGEYVSAVFPTDVANLVTLTDTLHASGVSYKFVVTNNGNVPLSNVVLAPGTGVTAVGSTRASSLAVGKTLTVLASAPWAEGQVIKTPSATASFTPSSGQVVRPSTSRRAVYLGVVSDPIDPTPTTVNVTVERHVWRDPDGFERTEGNFPKILADANGGNVDVDLTIQNNEDRSLFVTVTVTCNGNEVSSFADPDVAQGDTFVEVYQLPWQAGLVTCIVDVVAEDNAGNRGSATSTITLNGVFGVI